MICRKCKHDMPDGIRYCGHCGRKMTRLEYFVNWSFEKKRLPITLVVLALVIGLLVWGVVSLVNSAGDSDLPGSSQPAEVYDGPAVYPDLRVYLGEGNWSFANNTNVQLLTDGVNGVEGYMAYMIVEKDASGLLYDYMDLLVEEYHFEKLDSDYGFRFTGTNAPDEFAGGYHIRISITEEDEQYLYITYIWQADLESVDVQP